LPWLSSIGPIGNFKGVPFGDGLGGMGIPSSTENNPWEGGLFSNKNISTPRLLNFEELLVGFPCYY